jgi:hypothetical protein
MSLLRQVRGVVVKLGTGPRIAPATIAGKWDKIEAGWK